MTCHVIKALHLFLLELLNKIISFKYVNVLKLRVSVALKDSSSNPVTDLN